MCAIRDAMVLMWRHCIVTGNPFPEHRTVGTNLVSVGLNMSQDWHVIWNVRCVSGYILQNIMELLLAPWRPIWAIGRFFGGFFFNMRFMLSTKTSKRRITPFVGWLPRKRESFCHRPVYPKTPSLSLKYKHGCLTSSWEWPASGTELPDQFGQKNPSHWE